MAAQQIQDHVARARREPTTENIEAMWRAVFLLRGWYFLPSRDDEGPAHPVVSMVDGQPWLLAFTNVRRIQAFARSAGRAAPDGSVPLLVLDPKESMERILEVGDNIAGAIFDIGSDATFRAPVEALVAYAHHFGVPLDDD